MGMGFSKDFVIFLFISMIVGIGTGNPKYGLSFMGAYIIIKIIWKILT